jgi:UDP-N-acetylenolpyruvoylglucosamine reductase
VHNVMSGERVSLKDLNTFSLPARATNLVVAGSEEILVTAWHKTKNDNLPLLIPGDSQYEL